MPLTAEQKCLLWLSAAEISADRVLGLVEAYGSAQGIWEAFGKDDRLKFKDKPFQVLCRLHDREALDALWERLERMRVGLLFRDDPAYPELLAGIDDPPYLLYYAGNLAALRRPAVAVVGTRDPSRYGREMAISIARGLAEVGVAVVSGMARGIDSCAHEGALQAEGATIAVLGSGLNVPYPPENTGMMRTIAGSGLVISEYPLDAGPVTYHFPHRNRVISGLSHALVFVEGKVRSGGMLTVASALAQGREVFAVPGQVGTFGAEGPHTILREGARVATCAQDVLEDLCLELAHFHKEESQGEAPVSTLQAAILQALQKEPLGIEQLSHIIGREPASLIAELSMMEIMGQVLRGAGNLFSKAL